MLNSPRSLMRWLHAWEWSQRDIAKRVGVSQMTICRWMRADGLVPHGRQSQRSEWAIANADPDPLLVLADDPEFDTVHQPYSAWNQGFNAARMGIMRSLNPYDSAEEHLWWDDGYGEACEQGLYDCGA